MCSAPQSVTEVYQVTVSDPKPHPLKKFMMYKVRIEKCPVAVDQDSNVMEFYKRFSDFKKLERSLGTYHKQLYRAEKFPPLPSGFFNQSEPGIIEKRRKAAEEMLQFIYERQYLYKHTTFIEFCSSSCDTNAE
ncbi:unnamed protein product [Dicrocoelium dendriticum]|nr:unnamed protein product [Dicrocoelium dendriticum]